MHEGTVLLKFRIMLLAKQLPNVNALTSPTLRQLPAGIVTSRVVMKPLWSIEEWNEWCAALLATPTGKAFLPGVIAFRQQQAEIRKRPAQAPRYRHPTKRTPYTLKGQSRVVVQGTRPAHQ